MDNTEPQAKKMKLNFEVKINSHLSAINKTKSLQAVLGDEFYEPVPLTKVYVGHVKNVQDMSKIIAVLSEKVPLKELQHLKRARKREVILCPAHYLDGMASIQDFIIQRAPELTPYPFEYFKDIDVPSIAPKLKRQCVNLSWSCNFHPNKYYEKLVSDDFFNEQALKSHITYMKVAFESLRFHCVNNNEIYNEEEVFRHCNATVVVDPKINSIVAIGVTNKNHPIQHSVMVAIDNVAKTQHGGAWGDIQKNKFNCNFDGVSDKLKLYLQTTFSGSGIRFGARTYYSKTEIVANVVNDSEKPELKDSPYLCTGYYVYTIREPCLMCAMALVHSRVNRVFFCFDDLQNGALKSRTKIQAVSSLNHHFEVFTGYMSNC